MEKIEIKCPVCGKTEFVKIDKPYHEGFETYIQDYTQYYACTSCGLILRFAKRLVDSLVEQEFRSTEKGQKCTEFEKKAEACRNRINALTNKIKQLKEEKKNPNRTVKRDSEIGGEIEQCQKGLEAAKKDLESYEAIIISLRAK